MMLIKSNLIFLFCKFVEDKVIVGTLRSPTHTQINDYLCVNQFTFHELMIATRYFIPLFFLVREVLVQSIKVG
jgi:hypothetical protein